MSSHSHKDTQQKAFKRLRPFKLLKKILPERLLTRTLTILILPVLCVQLATGVVFWNRHWSETTTTLSRNISSEIFDLTESYNKSSRSDASKQALIQKAADVFDIELEILVDKSPEPFQKNDHATAPFLEQSLSKKLTTPFSFLISDPVLMIDVQASDGAVLRSSMNHRKLIPSATSLMIWWQVGAPLFFVLIAALFMRNQVRPLQSLAEIVSEFGKGRSVNHFKPSGALEVRWVGDAFQKMRERIHKQVRQRTEMLAGISHDLKTPLTRMQLELALQPDSDSKTALLEDVRDMQKMVEEYLGFAKGDGAELQKTVALSEFLRSLFTKFPQDALSLSSFKELETITLPLKPYAMKRALSNLISNALRYGTHMWFEGIVHQKEGSKEIHLIFSDNGPGIPEEKRSDVFRPFFRLDESRNVATGGYGLGLSICRDIITSHGGSVILDASQEHGGLKAAVVLPL